MLEHGVFLKSCARRLVIDGSAAAAGSSFRNRLISQERDRVTPNEVFDIALPSEALSNGTKSAIR